MKQGRSRTAYWDEELDQRIDAISKETGLSKSFIVRKALEKLLGEYKENIGKEVS